MNEYDLTIIPKFGKEHKAFRQAAVSRDWAKLVELVDSHTVEKRSGIFQTIAEFIFAEGYFICRFPDNTAETRRDKFTTWLDVSAKALLDQSGYDFVVKGIAYSQTVERLYRDAYSECCRLAVGDEPMSLVWAGIRLGHEEYVRWYKAAKTSAEQRSASDRISARLRSDTEGLESTFTDVAFKIDTVLQRELRFFGEQNGWFGEVLKIPSYQEAASKQVSKARRNALAVLNKVEDSDTRCSLFTGVLHEHVPAAIEESERITTLLSPVEWQVALCVAGERLQRRLDQLHEKVAVARTGREDGDHSIAELLATQQAPEHHVFQDLTGKVVQSNDEQFAGLTAWEWIRGYMAIRLLAQHYIHEAENLSDPCKIAYSRLRDFLMESGLSPSAAKRFADQCCYSKNSTDLHDCPLIRVGDDDLCLFLFPANTPSVTRLVLSRLSKLGIRFDEKGTELETRLQMLLTANGIRCGSFHRKGAAELQIDQLAVWDDTLFVFECKNFGLPSENPKHQHTFCQNQMAAARQLLTKVNAIKLEPGVVTEAIGNDATLRTIVPVVLNGMPFSLPGMVNGVYYTDYASLERFFGVGALHPNDPTSAATADFGEEAEPVTLWSGANPMVADLMQMLDENPHFKLLASSMQPELVTVQVAQAHFFCSNVLHRQPMRPG